VLGKKHCDKILKYDTPFLGSLLHILKDWLSSKIGSFHPTNLILKGSVSRVDTVSLIYLDQPILRTRKIGKSMASRSFAVKRISQSRNPESLLPTFFTLHNIHAGTSPHLPNSTVTHTYPTVATVSVTVTQYCAFTQK